MKIYKWSFLLTLALIVTTLLVNAACNKTQPNQPAVISSLTANPETVYIGCTSEILCLAGSVDDEILNYAWETTGGTISGTGETVTWHAPNIAGSYYINVTVDDGRGSMDNASIMVSATVPKGYLKISSSESGMSVYIDGENTGQTTPCKIEVPSGTHVVKLAAICFKDREETVEILTGETTEVLWTVDRTPEKTVTLRVGADVGEFDKLGKDAFVRSNIPDNNYGNSKLLWAGKEDDEISRIYLSFTINDIPSTAIITSAQIGLKLTAVSAGTATGSIGAYRVLGTWEEDVLSWNNQPSCSEIPDGETLLGRTVDEFIYWDVTHLVQGWINSSFTNYGVMLKDTNEATEEGHWMFHSSEETPDQYPPLDPLLTISYYDPAP